MVLSYIICNIISSTNQVLSCQFRVPNMTHILHLISICIRHILTSIIDYIYSSRYFVSKFLRTFSYYWIVCHYVVIISLQLRIYSASIHILCVKYIYHGINHLAYLNIDITIILVQIIIMKKSNLFISWKIICSYIITLFVI